MACLWRVSFFAKCPLYCYNVVGLLSPCIACMSAHVFTDIINPVPKTFVVVEKLLFARISFLVSCGHLLERADLLALVVMFYCVFSLSHVVSWIRCGTSLYRFLIFAAVLNIFDSYVIKTRL